MFLIEIILSFCGLLNIYCCISWINANVFDIEKLHLEFHLIHKFDQKPFVLSVCVCVWSFSGFLGCDKMC